jgi:hypothetical protein
VADVQAGTGGASGQSIRWIRWLVVTNLAMVALQPISAGLLMSGFGRALPAHAVVGLTLQLGLLVQVGAAVVLWWRGRVPAWVAGVSAGLFVVVLLQSAFGHNRQYWLHVPIGVALVGALNRQRDSLDALRRTE